MYKRRRLVINTCLGLSFQLKPGSILHYSSYSCLNQIQTFLPFRQARTLLPLPKTLVPVPKKVDFTVSVHGHTLQDPYRWMTKKDDPDFINHLQQENSFAHAFMADTQGLQQLLYDSMTRDIPSEVTIRSFHNGSWKYFQRIPEGKEHPVIIRKLEKEDGSICEQLLVDFSQIAAPRGYVDVEWNASPISPDDRYLAYLLDTVGDERYRLHIRDLESNSILLKEINNVVGFEWAKDSSFLIYTAYDEYERQFSPHKVQLTKLGSDNGDGDDVVIYTEYDSTFDVDIEWTCDGEFMIVNSMCQIETSSEVYVLNASKPGDGLRIIHKRQPGVECSVEHLKGFFYKETNAPIGENKIASGNYYLACCSVEDVESNSWKIVIPPGENVCLSDMYDCHEQMVLDSNNSGSLEIKMPDVTVDNGMYQNRASLDDDKDVEVIRSEGSRDEEDSDGTSDDKASNSSSDGEDSDSSSNDEDSDSSSDDKDSDSSSDDEHSDSLSDDEDSDSSGDDEHRDSLSDDEASDSSSDDEHSDSSSDDEDSYRSSKLMDSHGKYAFEEKEVISQDGVSIPLKIMYSPKMYDKSGKSPGLLHVYGAYGNNCSVPKLKTLLDAGWIFAFADVRGGESGDDPCWHEKGRKSNKINSVKDFVACGEYLINEGYVNEYRLTATGASAGGFLVGAAINMSPQLFTSAVLNVPFVDVCNSILDPSLPLRLSDFQEIGKPELKSEFESILSYSPYDNIHEGVRYPSMLVTTNFHDVRVPVGECAKWVSKIRESTLTNCSSIILKASMIGGHFGERGDFSYYFNYYREKAFEYAFLMKAMGMHHNAENNIHFALEE